MSYENYPTGFQCPQIKPYSLGVDMGVLRTPMQGGNARQRRMYRHMPTVFRLEFIIQALDLGEWQSWVNRFAYDYFVINIESMWSGSSGVIAAPHLVRFISDLEMENVTYGWIRVRVQAELSPNQWSIAGPLLPTYQWIVGGTPGAPAGMIPPTTLAGVSPGVTLSNGNRTATFAEIGDNQHARAGAGISPGEKKFLSVTYGAPVAWGAFGLSDPNFPYWVTDTTVWIGMTGSVGSWHDDSQIFVNGVAQTGGPVWTGGDIVDLAIDRGADLLWFRVNGGPWTGGAAPENATGGVSVSSLAGVLYPTFEGWGDVATTNFGGPFTYPPPAGFGLFVNAATGSWMSAGSATTPAGPDWITAGTPNYPAAIL